MPGVGTEEIVDQRAANLAKGQPWRMRVCIHKSWIADCMDNVAEIQGTCNVSKGQHRAKLVKEDHWVLIQLRE